MRVVITIEELVQKRACNAYLTSPDWKTEGYGDGALVYEDWDATVQRLLSTGPGTSYLGYLVKNELVPMTSGQLADLGQSETPEDEVPLMTKEQFVELSKASRQQTYSQINGSSSDG